MINKNERSEIRSFKILAYKIISSIIDKKIKLKKKVSSHYLPQTLKVLNEYTNFGSFSLPQNSRLIS